MTASDAFMLVMRWLHVVSAAAWIGGSLFYLLVLRPALRRSPDPLRLTATREFRALVDTSIFVLLVTGVMLTLDRLTPGVVGMPYVIVLAAKIVLSLWMFHLARGRRRYTPLAGPARGAGYQGFLAAASPALRVQIQRHRHPGDRSVPAGRPAQGAV